MKHADNRLKNISNLLKSAEKNLRKANKMLDALRDEVAGSYDDIPGVLGTFDGTHMVDVDGKKYEVNPNYVAKSMLLPGDNLKMVEGEEGKQLFKQVSKVERKSLEGILNKKEGKWYALTDAGSYRVLDVAIEFRGGEINDEVTVLIPAENLKSEWCALEKMAKEAEKKAKEVKEETAEEKKEEKKPVKKSTPRKKVETKEEKVPEKKNTPRKSPPKKKEPEAVASEVNSLLDDDDLR